MVCAYGTRRSTGLVLCVQRGHFACTECIEDWCNKPLPYCYQVRRVERGEKSMMGRRRKEGRVRDWGERGNECEGERGE